MILSHDINSIPKTAICLSIVFLLLQLTIPAMAFNLRKMNNPESLSSGVISSIYQDEKGLIWVGTSRGLDIYDGKRVSSYNPKHHTNFFTGSNIEQITQTNDSLLWIQTYHGLHKINTQSSAIESFDMFNCISFMDKDLSGNIYLIQGNYCIYYRLKDHQRFEQIFVPGLRENDILRFFVDHTNKLWIFQKNGTNLCFFIRIDKQGNIALSPLEGYKHPAGMLYAGVDDDSHISYFIDDTYALYEFDTSARKPRLICGLKALLVENDEITSLIKFHNDYFIGFKTKGLSLLRKTDPGYELEEIDVPGGINCLYKDKYQDLIWIGTSGHGLYLYSMDMYSIRSLLMSDLMPTLQQPISALLVDKANTLWLGSKGGGLLRIFNFQIDKKIQEQRMELMTASNCRLRDNVILSLTESGQGNLWIGSEKGLSYFDNKRNHTLPVSLSVGEKEVVCISDVYEQDSLLWVSTLGMGVIKTKLEWRNGTPMLTVVKQFTVKNGDEYANRFQDIYPDGNSVLWCMNMGEGAYKLNMATSKFENIRFEGHAMNVTNVIRKDCHGNYLIGTNSGLLKYNPGSYKVLSDVDGFPPNSVYGILLESNSDYWLSTNRGLILYSTDTGSIRSYDHHDGLSVLEFSEGASFRDEHTGTLYFGGTNGIVILKRNYFDEGQHYMPLISFRIITIHEQQYPIEQFLSQQGEGTFLKLSSEQNFFTLSFAAIDHLNGNSYSYYYKLEGEGKEWTDNGNSNVISFADLRPGTYRLLVKYYNRALGKESYICRIDIKVLPPWYASFWAYSVYLLLSFTAVLLVAFVCIARNRKKKEEQLHQIEQKHKEEIYESKLQFFTNISHEFCTPLTLIHGPCNQLMEQKGLTESARRYASVIRQNAERLNVLIQDLIEFNRIESGYKKPVIVPLDISYIIGRLTESFAAMAESQQICFEKDISSFLRWNSDKDFIVTILSNLLSNAFKYVGNTKTVKIRAGMKEDHLWIIVSNTGKGIASKDISTLFDRYHILQHFERNDSFWSRNGLGLAISHNMVRLLGGTIQVESLPDEWTHFRVQLPFLELSEPASDKMDAVSLLDYRSHCNLTLPMPEYNMDILKPTILIVDDEMEIQWLIVDIFKNDYNVQTATGAAEALDILKEVSPDVIISDVVMQGLDGLSFSRQVKSDEATAHIPFIFLSAKRDIGIQTEGLNAGADIYITKPFNVGYLKSSVRRLLERKENLKEYFSSPLSSYTLKDGKLSHKEHRKLIHDILRIINKNISNKELAAHVIAEKMNMGVRSLYRKLEEVNDITLADLINDCRMAKATDLLVKTKLTIDEIVYQAGFTNRSTFYRAFSKKYNCTPTRYRKDTLKSMQV